jgi:hypothetical protein
VKWRRLSNGDVRISDFCHRLFCFLAVLKLKG